MYIKNYLPTYLKEIKEEKDGILTGIEEFDKHQDGLTPGLYLFGAVSGLGKSSLSLQIADFMAAMGEQVMFFSLEMSPLELVSKSLSRLMYIYHGQVPYLQEVTAAAIMKGKHRDCNELFDCIREYYTPIANNLQVSTVRYLDEIIKEVKSTINTLKEKGIDKKPVIFIDYIQLIRLKENNLDIRSAINRVVQELKILSEEEQLVIWCISSFNRENYTNKASLSCFKESGDLEYTANGVFALQLKIIADAKEKVTAEQIAAEMQPQDGFPFISYNFCCLKSRFGRHFSIYLDFRGISSYFIRPSKNSSL